MIATEFLDGLESWSSHRVPLLMALISTDGPVAELGVGHGSTPYLKALCASQGRKLYSFENDIKHLNEMSDRYPAGLMHQYCIVAEGWDRAPIEGPWSVVLIDHAPGERRVHDMIRLKDRAQVIVAHDTEPVGAGNYGYAAAWPHFRYRKDYEEFPAWATAVSNTIDVTKWEWPR